MRAMRSISIITSSCLFLSLIIIDHPYAYATSQKASSAQEGASSACLNTGEVDVITDRKTSTNSTSTNSSINQTSNDISSSSNQAVAAEGDSRALQEAYVYQRTGSRFFPHLSPHCPEEPEYPPELPLEDIIANWHPNDRTIPLQHYSTICRFDYMKDYAKAMRYRDADVPFIIYNIPDFDEQVSKWSTRGYLANRLNDGKTYRVDASKNNFFKNYDLPYPDDWTPPFDVVNMTFDDWMTKVEENPDPVPEEPHYYFRFFADQNDVIKEDFHFFFGERQDPLFMEGEANPNDIRCRWGMPGNIAAPHFDAPKNMAATITGMRRWILAAPEQCENTYVINTDHDDSPCYRHSEVRWDEPDYEKYPLFKQVTGHEVILMAGEVLYMPSYWLHQVINLSLSLQCNGFSPVFSTRGFEVMRECGFYFRQKTLNGR